MTLIRIIDRTLGSIASTSEARTSSVIPSNSVQDSLLYSRAVLDIFKVFFSSVCVGLLLLHEYFFSLGLFKHHCNSRCDFESVSGVFTSYV